MYQNKHRQFSISAHNCAASSRPTENVEVRRGFGARARRDMRRVRVCAQRSVDDRPARGDAARGSLGRARARPAEPTRCCDQSAQAL